MPPSTSAALKKPPVKKGSFAGIPKWGLVLGAILGLVIGYMIIKKS